MATDDLRLQDLNALLTNLKVKADTEHCSLVISIDLGTTYSGYVSTFRSVEHILSTPEKSQPYLLTLSSIGYIFTSDPEKVHILDQWPGPTSLKVSSPKVPTVLKYGSGGHGFSWGYQVGLRDEKKVEAFKLLLDPNLPKPEYIQIVKVQKNFREFVKTPIDAVNDFMGALYRYAIAAIEEKHTQKYAEILDVKFVVSTPAGWPEAVKSLILKVGRVLQR